ncbi:MAG: PepSY domain-containing protein [Novosphingobium sp.]
MTNLKIALASVSLLAALGTTPLLAKSHGFVGQNLAHLAHVTMPQARGIALHARPGRITDQELEREAGGSGLRYSFDITSAGHKFEVGVDAANGAVLENVAEGAHPD